jgi:hypothetical protein
MRQIVKKTNDWKELGFMDADGVHKLEERCPRTESRDWRVYASRVSSCCWWKWSATGWKILRPQLWTTPNNYLQPAHFSITAISSAVVSARRKVWISFRSNWHLKHSKRCIARSSKGRLSGALSSQPIMSEYVRHSDVFAMKEARLWSVIQCFETWSLAVTSFAQSEFGSICR